MQYAGGRPAHLVSGNSFIEVAIVKNQHPLFLFARLQARGSTSQ